jgi:hypothetical protein
MEIKFCKNSPTFNFSSGEKLEKTFEYKYHMKTCMECHNKKFEDDLCYGALIMSFSKNQKVKDEFYAKINNYF